VRSQGVDQPFDGGHRVVPPSFCSSIHRAKSRGSYLTARPIRTHGNSLRAVMLATVRSQTPSALAVSDRVSSSRGIAVTGRGVGLAGIVGPLPRSRGYDGNGLDNGRDVEQIAVASPQAWHSAGVGFIP